MGRSAGVDPSGVPDPVVFGGEQAAEHADTRHTAISARVLAVRLKPDATGILKLVVRLKPDATGILKPDCTETLEPAVATSSRSGLNPSNENRFLRASLISERSNGLETR